MRDRRLETNVNVEKLRASETECTNAKNSLNTKFEGTSNSPLHTCSVYATSECNTEADKRKQQVDEYLKMNGEHEDAVSTLKKQIENFTTIIVSGC